MSDSQRESLKVLLIDDDPDDAALIGALLSGAFNATYEVTWVRTWSEGERAILAGDCDAALVDLHLGARGGLELLRAVRGEVRACPLIVLTGATGKGVDHDALLAGATDYLAKDRLTSEVLDRALRYGITWSRQRRDIIERERFLRAMFEGGVDAQLIFDERGIIVEANPAACKLYGRDKTGLVGVSMAALPSNTSVATLAEWGIALAESGRVEGETEIRASAESRICEFRATRILENRFLAVVRDVTEQRQMHRRLMMSERMASIGTLAAGVAHEINNPLAFISANLTFVRDELATAGISVPQAVCDALEDTESGAARIAAIVRDLKSMSRPQDQSDGEVHHLRPILELAARMAATEVRHRARYTIDLAPAPLVRASASKLGQVFLNLIVNAAQAIAEGSAAANEVRVVLRASDDGYAVVEVSDTGKGIAEEHLSRIFDPFFTTKPAGVGTGLGLAIVQRIIAAAGGRISVKSELGKGTTFRVELPPAEAAEAAPALVAAKSTASRRGRVLVVDDERLILNALSRMLSSQHEVVTAVTATEALARIKLGESYDVIFCDMMMPNLSGAEFHSALRQLSPSLAGKVVFMTGGVFTSDAERFLSSVPNRKVDKPLNLDVAAQIVAESIAG